MSLLSAFVWMSCPGQKSVSCQLMSVWLLTFLSVILRAPAICLVWMSCHCQISLLFHQFLCLSVSLLFCLSFWKSLESVLSKCLVSIESRLLSSWLLCPSVSLLFCLSFWMLLQSILSECLVSGKSVFYLVNYCLSVSLLYCLPFWMFLQSVLSECLVSVKCLLFCQLLSNCLITLLSSFWKSLLPVLSECLVPVVKSILCFVNYCVCLYHYFSVCHSESFWNLFCLNVLSRSNQSFI